MHALRQEILPPSGVEFLATLRLTPTAIGSLPTISDTTARHAVAPRVLCNVVVARSNLLRIFEVREEAAPLPDPADIEKLRNGSIRRGTEAVEGEVEMDEGGEGWVNIAKSSQLKGRAQPTVTRFYLVREHSLHGIVTGIEAVRTISSQEDNLERLLVSFKDAKIALLEWSDVIHDLVTVSIHTYERAPQVASSDTTMFRSMLRVDGASRCAALLLPQDALAILPFIQSLEDLDAMDQDQPQAREAPYLPSYILDLPTDMDENIHNVIDFAFLPGFTNATVAVLFQTQQTCTGRLKEFKDTTRLIIFTLDLSAQHYPKITSAEGLPYDCEALVPCSASVGGVIVLAANSIIYLDQSARRVVLPVNGWLSRISDIPAPIQPADERNRNLELEGCRAAFIDDKTLFIILRDGTVYPVELTVDAKVVSKLVMGPALAQTTIPTAARMMDSDHLLVASTVGPSVLMKAVRVDEEVDSDVASEAPATAVVDTSDARMFVDSDDEDLYGPSKPKATTGPSAVASGKQKRSVIHLSLCDSLPAYGPIADMTFSATRLGDRFVPELVAATGSGHLGGFTVFQRDLPMRTKRKLHAIGGARGMWSLPIRQHVKVSGISYEKPANLYQAENDTLILSTDAIPTPGLSRIATRSNNKADISITTRIPNMTVGAAPFFQRTAILHVMTNSLRVLEPDGSERQIIKDVDGNVPRPKIRACSILDPFVLILREDDSIGLFIGETERGKIRRKDMSAMGDKTSRYVAGCFFSDTTGLFENKADRSPSANGTNGADATSTLQAAVSAGHGTQWLILVRPQGTTEIWTLPKLTLAFSTPSFTGLLTVVTDSHEQAALSLPQDPPRKPEEFDIEHILVAPLGQSSPRLHLFVFLRSGVLAVYEALPASPAAEQPAVPRAMSAGVKFVKVVSKAFEIQRPEEAEKGILAEQKRISRTFIPFVTTPTPGTTYSGVFFTGDNPTWIVATDKSGVQLHPSGHAVVHAFTTCSLWESKGEFLVYSDEGPSLLEWVPDYNFDCALPSRSVPRGRPYSNVVFDVSTSLIVAASSLQSKFASYDEDGQIVWQPDAPNVQEPMCDCSALELISPDMWTTMDGYEFAFNEFVNDVCVVSLETGSTESGIKDFIAVGTTVDRGEDLSAKGATYIFEIVEVVPEARVGPERWYRLRLRCRDDAKGPVTALAGFPGYLVSSMGQKIFVRALDLDERLVGVAFLDVGVYVTTLRTMKNLLLVGDAEKSVTFVAFQEDPYKLVFLAKDIRRACVARADFFFAEDDMVIVTADEEGIVRTYEYNPHDPDSNDGRRLLLHSEFNTQSECRTSAVIARRTKDDYDIPQAKLLHGTTDGTLACFTALDELAYKRLQLLQGQLTRNIQHVAGLNPRALRIIRNDTVAKSLTKGILDGNLLSHFEQLPIQKQAEVTRQIGTERETIVSDWIAVAGPW